MANNVIVNTTRPTHMQRHFWRVGINHIKTIQKHKLANISPSNASAIPLARRCAGLFHLNGPRVCNLDPNTRSADPQATVTKADWVMRRINGSARGFSLTMIVFTSGSCHGTGFLDTFAAPYKSIIVLTSSQRVMNTSATRPPAEPRSRGTPSSRRSRLSR